MSVIEPDFSDPSGDEYEALARDHVPVRSMTEADLPAIIAIDRKLNGTGRDRTAYYEGKLAEMLTESGVRVSLVAEVEGQFAGFVMARLDYGESGRTAPAAVLDTIGVAPVFQSCGVASALMSQLLLNLRALDVEAVYTRVAWNAHALLGYFERSGFAPSQRLCFRKAL